MDVDQHEVRGEEWWIHLVSNRVWFTADTHLGHDRIIQYCRRPFTSADEMEQVMLDRFNSVLEPGDILYHLGDASWSTYDLRRFFGQLRCRNIHLVLGNHDKKKLDEYRQWFTWVGEYKKITTGDGTQVILFHYPIRSWVGKGHGAYHVHGHCHGMLPDSGERSVDVGVDVWDYTPVSLEQIVAARGVMPYYADWNREGAYDPQAGTGLWDKGPGYVPSHLPGATDEVVV